MTKKVGLFFRASSGIYGRRLIAECYEAFELNFILNDEFDHRLTQYQMSHNQKVIRFDF